MPYTYEQNIAYITVGTLIILLNSLEIYLIVRRWRKIKPYEHLLLNLAIADFLVGGVRCGTAIYEIHHSRWVQDKTASTVMRSLIMFSVDSSGTNISLISIDRLVAIKFPLEHRIWMSKRNARIVNALTWIITILCIGSYAFFIHVSTYDSMEGTIEVAVIMSFGWIMVIVHILLFKYIFEKQGITSDDQNTRVSHKRAWEKKVILTCTLFVVTYIICTWPGCIEHLISSKRLLSFKTVILIAVNSLIDPCLYFFKDYLRRTHKRGYRATSAQL